MGFFDFQIECSGIDEGIDSSSPSDIDRELERWIGRKSHAYLTGELVARTLMKPTSMILPRESVLTERQPYPRAHQSPHPSSHSLSIGTTPFVIVQQPRVGLDSFLVAVSLSHELAADSSLPKDVPLLSSDFPCSLNPPCSLSSAKET